MRSQACSELQRCAAVSPFAQLVALAGRAPQPLAKRPHGVGGTKTEQLLDLIDRCAAVSTADLARGSGLDSRLVWGLLKVPRSRGQVHHTDGLWSLNYDYRSEDDAAVAAAAALLRSRGWTVIKPRRER